MAADIVYLERARTQRTAQTAPQSAARIPLRDLIELLAEEARIVAACGVRLLRAGSMNEPERRRLIAAVRRLERGAVHLREHRR